MSSSPVTVERHVAAPIEDVFAVVGDPVAVARCSPELQRIRWLDGARGPAVGARFAGTNRHGPFRWTTRCTITAYDPPRRSAHDVAFLGRVMARWTFELEAEGDGTRVRQVAEDLRPAWFARLSVLGTGVADRPAANRANVARTLDAVARQLEPTS